MKEFAVTSSPAGVYISRTKGKSIPRNAIVAQTDTYEEARIIRDNIRKSISEKNADSEESWHDKYNKAFESGDMDVLNRLCGIR